MKKEVESRLSGSTGLASWNKIEPKEKVSPTVLEPKINKPINWKGLFSWFFFFMSWLKSIKSGLISSFKAIVYAVYVKAIYEPLLSLSFIVMPVILIVAMTRYCVLSEMDPDLFGFMGMAINIAAIICAITSLTSAKEKGSEHIEPVPVIASFIAVVTIMALNMVILLNAPVSDLNLFMLFFGFIYFLVALMLNVYRLDKMEIGDE